MPAAPRRSRKSAAAAEPVSLEARIHACYGTLPGSEVTVADVLLNQPGRLATHSATELAAAAGASKAAVTRLIQRLGYAGYAEARRHAREAQQWGSPIYQEAAGRASAASALSAHVASDQQLLALTLAALSEQDLQEAALAMAKARRVVVFGFRNSAWLAMYARSQLGLLRGGVELAPLPAETLAEGLAELGADDLVLAIGFRRRVPAFAVALNAARGARAKIVLVTDPSGAADLAMSDWTLTCHCRGDSMFDSYVAGVSVINFLAMRLSDSLGMAGRRRLKNVERWHEMLGDLA